MSSTTSPAEVHAFVGTEAEYRAISRLHQLVSGEDVSPDAWRRQDHALRQGGYTWRRFLAVDGASQEVVGFGQISHVVNRFSRGRFELWLGVEPDWRGRGVGSQLHSRLERELRTLGAEEVTALVGQDAVPFFLRRGWSELRRSWQSTLDLERADLAGLPERRDRLAAEGVVLTTLAGEREARPDWLGELHQLHTALKRDEPSAHPYTPLSREDFERLFLGQPELLVDAYFLARARDGLVGESFLFHESEDELHTGFTGVLPAWRRRGIALTLKLEAIRWARQRGYRRIVTSNDSLNRPMLALNEKLGFRRGRAMLQVAKRLQEPA